MWQPQRKSSQAMLVIGIILTVVGLSLGIAFPYIYNAIMTGQLQLYPPSLNYKMWLKTPIPLYMDFYLYNWTNVDDVLENGAKPHFVEVGPFVFLEVHDRVNMTWIDCNHTVTFKQKRTWHFVPELSVDIETPVTNINPLAVAAAHITRYWGPVVQYGLNSYLLGVENLTTTATAIEWLFDGYESPSMNLIRKVLNETGMTSPTPIPLDRFAWFRGRNESINYDGVFNMYTGVDDLRKLGLLNAWNHQHQTNYYGDECGVIRGSTGEVFPPFPQDYDKIPFFAPDICGTINIQFFSMTKVRGLEGYQYMSDYRLYDNGSLYPENKCYCLDECLPSGVLNVTRCKFGVPAFISLPHFHRADPVYREQIDGMTPDPGKHDIVVTFEKETGLPLEASAKIQINLLLNDFKMSFFQNLNRTLLPILWIDERTVITPDLSDLLSLVLGLKVALPIVLYILFAVGLILAGWGGWRLRQIKSGHCELSDNSSSSSSR